MVSGKDITSHVSAITLATAFQVSYVYAADPACTKGVFFDTKDLPAGHGLKDKCIDALTFGDYVQAGLDVLMPFVLFIALLMVIWSGVQYMLGGLTPDGQKQAKQRISGILAGTFFFLFIRFIANQIDPTISM